MYKLRPPLAMNVHPVFLSSSDEEETRRLRSRIKGLIDDVINPQLLRYREAESCFPLRCGKGRRRSASPLTIV